MSPYSPLNDFGYEEIIRLLKVGVGMVYNRSLEGMGEWDSGNLLVKIKPDGKKKRKKWEEDITILHEWLHAYEELILKREEERLFRESQIEWWARFHYQREPGLVECIRGYFREEGF